MTKYIPIIQADSIGEWVIDKENYGTTKQPTQMPFVGFSETNVTEDGRTLKELENREGGSL